MIILLLQNMAPNKQTWKFGISLVSGSKLTSMLHQPDIVLSVELQCEIVTRNGTCAFEKLSF